MRLEIVSNKSNWIAFMHSIYEGLCRRDSLRRTTALVFGTRKLEDSTGSMCVGFQVPFSSTDAPARVTFVLLEREGASSRSARKRR